MPSPSPPAWSEYERGWHRDPYVVEFVGPNEWDVFRYDDFLVREATASAGRSAADQDRRDRIQRAALGRNGVISVLAIVVAITLTGVIQGAQGGLPLWALPGLIIAVGVASWTLVSITLVLLRTWWRSVGRRLISR